MHSSALDRSSPITYVSELFYSFYDLFLRKETFDNFSWVIYIADIQTYINVQSSNDYALILKNLDWLCIEEGVIFGENVLIFKMSGSETLICPRITWRACKTQIADSVGLEWRLRICLSSKLPAPVAATGLGPHFENSYFLRM